MNNIVAEIVELLKDGTDTIERETNLHRYIGKVICGFGTTYCVAATQHAKAVEKMQSYIEQHYELSQTLVLSNSDGGLDTVRMYLIQC